MVQCLHQCDSSMMLKSGDFFNLLNFLCCLFVNCSPVDAIDNVNLDVQLYCTAAHY